MTGVPAFDEHVLTAGDGGFQHLTCPGCGGGYLHHEDVTVYDRVYDGRENAADTKQTRVAAGKATTMVLPSKVCRNPSNRRDGIVVAFWCEDCSALSELTIAQHKGYTLTSWRFTGERTPAT